MNNKDIENVVQSQEVLMTLNPCPKKTDFINELLKELEKEEKKQPVKKIKNED